MELHCIVLMQLYLVQIYTVQTYTIKCTIARCDNSKNSLDRPPDLLHPSPRNLIRNRFDSLHSYGYYNLSLHHNVDIKIALFSVTRSSVYQAYTSTNLIRKDMEIVMKSLNEIHSINLFCRTKPITTKSVINHKLAIRITRNRGNY